MSHAHNYAHTTPNSSATLARRFAIHHATLQPEPMTRTVHWPEELRVQGSGRPDQSR